MSVPSLFLASSSHRVSLLSKKQNDLSCCHQQSQLLIKQKQKHKETYNDHINKYYTYKPRKQCCNLVNLHKFIPITDNEQENCLQITQTIDNDLQLKRFPNIVPNIKVHKSSKCGSTKLAVNQIEGKQNTENKVQIKVKKSRISSKKYISDEANYEKDNPNPRNECDKPIQSIQHNFINYSTRNQYDPYFPHQSLEKIVNSQRQYGPHIQKTEFKEGFNIQEQQFVFPKTLEKTNQTSIRVIEKQPENYDGQFSTVSFTTIKDSYNALKQAKSNLKQAKSRKGIQIYSQKLTNTTVQRDQYPDPQHQMIQVESIYHSSKKNEEQISSNISSPKNPVKIDKSVINQYRINQSLKKIEEQIFNRELEEEMNSLKDFVGQTNRQCSQSLKYMDQIIKRYQVSQTKLKQETLIDNSLVNTYNKKKQDQSYFGSFLQKLRASK